MNKYEKLILLLVTLVLLGRFGGLARDVYIAQTYGATALPPNVEQYWSLASIVIGGLVNIGAGFWLYIEAKSISLKGWVGGFWDFFSGFWAWSFFI